MPSLLEQIQDAAVDSQSDLAMVLRKCKVLAARLNSKPLEDWLLWESNGYPEDVAVPSYRTFTVTLKGHFSGPFGSGLRNTPVPLVCVPGPLRRGYENYECRQSIAVLGQLVEGSEGTLHLTTGDLNVILGGKVYRGMNCIQVWGEFGTANFVEILNSVRNRLLDFVLAIWKENPTAGEVTTSTQIESAQVTQIFHTTVYDGGSATLVGSAEHSSINTLITKGDDNSLREFLAKQGVSVEDLDGLKLAITTEDSAQEARALGPKVTAWLGQMAVKATEGGLKAGGTIVLKLITDALLKYYGIGY